MRERIPYLDALRCLAIFLVVLLHNDAPVVVNTACYGRPSWYHVSYTHLDVYKRQASCCLALSRDMVK